MYRNEARDREAELVRLWRWVRSLKESHFSESTERFSVRQFQTHICISEKSLPVEEELGVGELTLEGRQRRVSTEALGGTRS